MGTNCVGSCQKVRGGFENDIDAAKKDRRKKSITRKSLNNEIGYKDGQIENEQCNIETSEISE